MTAQSKPIRENILRKRRTFFGYALLNSCLHEAVRIFHGKFTTTHNAENGAHFVRGILV